MRFWLHVFQSLVGFLFFPPVVLLFTLTKLLMSYGRSSHLADCKEVKLLKAHVVSPVLGREEGCLSGAGCCAGRALIKQTELCCVQRITALGLFLLKGET